MVCLISSQLHRLTMKRRRSPSQIISNFSQTRKETLMDSFSRKSFAVQLNIDNFATQFTKDLRKILFTMIRFRVVLNSKSLVLKFT